MPTVKINNIDCYYETHGQGKPLVLIAGLGSDSQSWQPVLEDLAKHFKCVIFDNRGIGRTKCGDSDFSISAMTQDTASLMDALGIERANILGHSMGGCIAQEMAITYPERVEKLILAGSFSFTSKRNKLLFDNMAKSLEGGISYESFLKDFFCWILSPEFFSDKEQFDVALKIALDYPYPITKEGFRGQVEALNAFNSFDHLDKITAETLIIVGIKDILITLDDAGLLIKRIHAAIPVFLERAAHAVAMEDGSGFIKSVVNFLC